MSFWGNIFGTAKSTEKIIDIVASAGDKLFYTAEEKADNQGAAALARQAFVLEWLATTKGQNIARRLIALTLSAIWGLMFLGSTLLSIAAIWATDPVRLDESAKIIDSKIEQMTGAMMLILAFYFAAPHMGAIVTGALNRFGKVKS